MTGVIAKLLLDTLIIILLALTISYCWLLNRRIKILQDSKSELAQLLKYFDESTQRASESIVALQAASKKIGENIQTRIEKANYALDDLNFMIEKGSKLADQLEASFAVSRARGKAGAGSQAPARPTPIVREHAEEEEMPAPKRAPVLETGNDILVQRRDEEPAPSMTSREKTAASLGAVLERIAAVRGNAANTNTNGSANGAEKAQASNAASRSQAEQELLALLRTGMKG